MTSWTAMLVPMANSPTRLEFSSVAVYARKSSTRAATSHSTSDDAAVLDRDRERVVLQIAVAGAEIVADDAVGDVDAVDARRRGQDLAAREVAPLGGRDDAGRLEPLDRRVEGRLEARARRRGRHDLRRLLRALEDAAGDRVDLVEVGAHRLGHDAVRDRDHVGVADLAAVDDLRQRAAERELALFGLAGVDRDVGALEGRPDRGRELEHGPRAVVLHDVGLARRADLAHLVGEARGDLLGLPIGDDRDTLGRQDPQARPDGVAGAGDQVLGVGSQGSRLMRHRELALLARRSDRRQRDAAWLTGASTGRPWVVSSQM